MRSVLNDEARRLTPCTSRSLSAIDAMQRNGSNAKQSPDKGKRVLILTASAGSGHNAAAADRRDASEVSNGSASGTDARSADESHTSGPNQARQNVANDALTTASFPSAANEPRLNRRAPEPATTSE